MGRANRPRSCGFEKMRQDWYNGLKLEIRRPARGHPARAAAAKHNDTTIMQEPGIRKARIADYVRIARPDHWIKNLFIFPGLFLAIVVLRPEISGLLDLKAVAAFVSTSLVASANYVINEWLDAKFDRFHPVKKNRPVVQADLKAKFVYLEYAALAVAGLALALAVNRAFCAMALWLFVMGIVYNVEPLRTKDVPFLDVLSESVNNMIRLLMGWFIVATNTLPPCSVILGYWMCGAFLMATKRFAEYRMIGDPARAGAYRKSFRHYTEVSLLVSSFVYSVVATFLIGVFLVKYKIELLVAIPFLVALFAKYLAISFKKDSAAQKPEKLYREKSLMALTALFAASIVAGGLLDLPQLGVLTGTDLLAIPLP